eukprot:3517363-Rhodomonas_salina.1
MRSLSKDRSENRFIAQGKSDRMPHRSDGAAEGSWFWASRCSVAASPPGSPRPFLPEVRWKCLASTFATRLPDKTWSL